MVKNRDPSCLILSMDGTRDDLIMSPTPACSAVTPYCVYDQSAESEAKYVVYFFSLSFVLGLCENDNVYVACGCPCLDGFSFVNFVYALAVIYCDFQRDRFG